MSAVVLPPGAEASAAQIASGSGSNFLAGFIGLDAERRAGMIAIYAFCRVADDAVDDAPDADTGERHLAFWRGELAAAANGTAQTPVGRDLQQALQRFAVPRGPLEDLLDGVATDLRPRPFADDAELHTYCYRVAAAVGLACLPVLGANSDGARTFADALGHALQRTNILRDLAGDARGGRCYVPASWLAAAGVDRAWLDGSGPASAYGPDGPLAALCARLAAAARTQFARAHAALRSLPRRERRALVPARIMGAVYETLLGKLEQQRGDVRRPRVRLGKLQKLWIVLQVFFGVRA